MRLSTPLVFTDGAEATAQRVARWEQSGLDVVWVPEAYGFDAPTHLGYLAGKTRRVQLGAGILPVYSRSPALTAQTAAGLDFVSGGRAILGLGVSGPQVIEGWHGIPYDRPLERTREVIDVCRKIWRREVLSHRGTCYEMPLADGRGLGLGKPLRLLAAPVRPRIPIYVAALGQRNVELTAEIAEGWFPLFYVPEMAAEVWGETLARGGSRRAADLPPLEVVAGGTLAISDDPALIEEAQALDRARVALYVGAMGARNRNFYADLIRRYGYANDVDTIQQLYHSGNRPAAAAAVPDGLLAQLQLVGPASHVRDRVAAYKASGVTVLNVIPIGPEPERQLEQVKRWAEEA
jgi:F420-dependent oxidoreductase-like protein